MILVNPEIVSSSNATESDDEGCLSFPEIYGSIEVRCSLRRLSSKPTISTPTVTSRAHHHSVRSTSRSKRRMRRAAL